MKYLLANINLTWWERIMKFLISEYSILIIFFHFKNFLPELFNFIQYFSKSLWVLVEIFRKNSGVFIVSFINFHEINRWNYKTAFQSRHFNLVPNEYSNNWQIPEWKWTILNFIFQEYFEVMIRNVFIY